MLLLNQITELDQELDKVLQGEGNALAIESLELVYTNLVPSFDSLEGALSRRRIYKKLPGDYAIVSQSDEEVELAQSALSTVQSFKMIWDELEQKYTISQNDICSNTSTILMSLSKILNARNSGQYSSWITQISDEVSVSDSDLEQQENSPNLIDNAIEYRKVYRIFRNQINTVSPSEESIGSLQIVRKKLVELKDKMEFNQPEDVIKLFKHLRQVGNNGRAPLSMLTAEVLQWMSEQDQENYFYIGDKRISNRG